MKYSLATNWDSKLVKKISSNEKESNNLVVEFFGSCDYFTAVPSKKITKEEATTKINEIKESGYKFNYLLNSSLKIKSADLFAYVSWIRDMGVDILTIANTNNLSFLQKNFPQVPVNISIVYGLNTLVETKKLLSEFENIKRITLSQKVNRNKQLITQVAKYCHSRGIELELLANELCFLNCPSMAEHYYFGSKLGDKEKKKKNNKEDYFSISCNKKRANNPMGFLNTAWIRPEDVGLYEKIGVDIIKIAGRSLHTDYLTATVKAYLDEYFNGSVTDLFSNDWWPEKNKPFINNRKLDGLISYLWKKNLKGSLNEKSIPAKFKIKYKY